MAMRIIWHEIPDIISTKLLEFLDLKKTGQITLNVKDGKIQAIDIRETLRVSS